MILLTIFLAIPAILFVVVMACPDYNEAGVLSSGKWGKGWVWMMWENLPRRSPPIDIRTERRQIDRQLRNEWDQMFRSLDKRL